MLFTKDNNEKLILILDIESCAVRGSLILTESPDTFKIIFSHSVPIPWKPHMDSKYLIEVTEKAVKQTINSSLQYLHVHSKSDNIPNKISSIHYALSSPWIISQAKLISMTFEKNTVISREYIMQLIEKERAKIMPSQSEPLRVVEEKIFDVRLNGYSVTDWQGRETRRLDVSFTMSLAGAHTTDRFVALCEHVVHARQVHFHSSLLLQFIGVEKTMHTGEDYTLIRIHGELTDIAVIHNQYFVFFGSFPFGARSFIRKVASATKTDLHTADSLITLYTGNHLDPLQNKKAYSVIKNTSDEWANSLSKVLSLSPQKIQLTKSVVLSSCAHEDCFSETLHKLYSGTKVSIISETNLLPIAVHSMK